MRIKLDMDDMLSFSTLTHPQLGQHRALVIKVQGKTFSVWHSIDRLYLTPYSLNDKDYIREIDTMLVKSMEQMLTKIFTDACAAVPVGTELLKP